MARWSPPYHGGRCRRAAPDRDHESRERKRHAHPCPAAEDGEREPGRTSGFELGPEHGERHSDRKPVEEAGQAHHQRHAAVLRWKGQRAGKRATQGERRQSRGRDPPELDADGRAAAVPPIIRATNHANTGSSA